MVYMWREIKVILQLIRRTKVKNFDPNTIDVKQIFYESKDGTKIPMFILHKKVRLF